jgi:protein disulfide-isomerase A1
LENYRLTIGQSGRSIVYYVSAEAKQRQLYVDQLRPLAKKYKEYLKFAMVDAEEYSEVASALGVTPDELPAIVVQNPTNGQLFHYGLEKEISAANIEQFLVDIAGGKVTPWVGSRDGSSPRDDGHDEL